MSLCMKYQNIEINYHFLTRDRDPRMVSRGGHVCDGAPHRGGRGEVQTVYRGD